MVHLPNLGEHIRDQGGGEKRLGNGIVQVAGQAGAFGGHSILGGFFTQALVGQVQLIGALSDALFQEAAIFGFLFGQSFGGLSFLGDICDDPNHHARRTIGRAGQRIR